MLQSSKERQVQSEKGIYLMQNNKYVVGCASAELEHLKIVADMMRKGAISTKAQAKAELLKLRCRS